MLKFLISRESIKFKLIYKIIIKSKKLSYFVYLIINAFYIIFWYIWIFAYSRINSNI